MKSLKELQEKIDALSPRERMILLVVAIAGVWALMDGLLLGPQDKARQAERQRLEDARATLAQAQETLALEASRPSPAAAARQRLETARQTLAARMNAAGRLEARLVPPRDMARVLEGLTGNQPGLRLLQLRSLAPEPLGNEADAGQAALFRHGVRITLAGDYAALTRYMAALAALPVGFYWSSAELDASRHPAIELTLTLYTLSLERTWLTV